jgi:RNA polymerase sigma factor (sigma-70 family)
MTAIDDADLVSLSRSGDLDAFGELVARYQSLVCSLAYSATGSLPQSEDLAQETFLTAWRQLAHLREPAKLRSWLCGIARNLINNAVRKQGREPVHRAEQIEDFTDHPDQEPNPTDQAVTNEEAALLWRSLEKIPETYREPLVLFYRERQSIQTVAASLELSEDAVKQRLSRGRKMLEEKMSAFVETALTRTAPTRAFTLAVLAALPAFSLSASAATVGAAAAKGSTTASAATAVSILNILIGPVIGILGAWLGIKASIDSTRTPRERQYMIRQAKFVILATVFFNIAIFAFIFLAIPHFRENPILFGSIGILIPVVFAFYILLCSLRVNKQFTALREVEQKAHPENFHPSEFQCVREYKSKLTLLGLPLIHMRSGKLPGQPHLPARGWIAMGDRAFGILFAGGGLAVGGIAMGGLAIGPVAIGGLTFGALALGGLAIGALALGGGAIGLVSAGGFALAWFGAEGGMAIASNFAVGGMAIAAHANDPAAFEFFKMFKWIDIRRAEVRNTAASMGWLPVLLVIGQALFLQRRRKFLRQK